MTVTNIILIVIIFLLLVFLFLFSEDKDKLREKILQLKRENQKLKEENYEYHWKYFYEISQISSRAEMSENVIKILKEAMKLSHPDNGGNSAEFQKYRKIYNILIGKEN